MESRHSKSRPALAKSSPLPVDFLKMVNEVFSTNFDAGLKALSKIKPDPFFQASGLIYSNEIVLAITLAHKDQLAATTLYASCDFDPKASSPTVQDLLGACVDAVGSVYGALLDPAKKDRLEQLADESLSALENVPFEWTPLELDRYKVFVKVDKSNPALDDAAEEFLKKNDPEYQDRLEREHKETEELFVTGPKARAKSGQGSGTLH